MSQGFCGITEATTVSSPSSTTTYVFEVEFLHADILGNILDQVILLKDFIRFGAVCKGWHTVFLQKKRHRMERCNHELPFLFFPTPFISGKPPPNYKIIQSRNLLDVFETKWYNSISPAIYFRNTRCSSSSYGYVATTIREGEFTNIILNNPITGNMISLPHIPCTCLYFNVVLSCNPCLHPDKCLVAYSTNRDELCSMGIIRLGGNTWTQLTTKLLDKVAQCFFHKGKLHALGQDGQLFAFDCHWGLNNADKCDFEVCHIVKTSKTLELFSCVKLFMVESVRGDLLMIEMDLRINSKAISMHKLVITNNDGSEKMKGDWVGIHRIGNGDEVLFTSGNSVVCVLASKCLNLQPNSAYHFQITCTTDERYDDIQKFTLNTSELQQGVSTAFGVTLKERGGNRSPTPFWINPTLQ